MKLKERLRNSSERNLSTATWRTARIKEALVAKRKKNKVINKKILREATLIFDTSA